MSEPDEGLDALLGADLHTQLAQQAELIAELTAQRDDLQAELATGPPIGDVDDDTEDAQPPTVYVDVAQFVSGWLAPRSERVPAWCEQWWKHPMALTRLRALWQSWEVANAEGGAAMSKWLMYDFDHHMNKLTAKPGGTFHECNGGNHRTGELTVTAPTAELELPPEPL